MFDLRLWALSARINQLQGTIEAQIKNIKFDKNEKLSLISILLLNVTANSPGNQNAVENI